MDEWILQHFRTADNIGARSQQQGGLSIQKLGLAKSARSCEFYNRSKQRTHLSGFFA